MWRDSGKTLHIILHWNHKSFYYPYYPTPVDRKALRIRAKTQGEGKAKPLIDPSHHPSGRTLYVSLEMLLGIGEGVPIAIRCRGGPYQGQGVGTVWAAKESIWSPVSAGLFLFQARSHPQASCAASWSAYLAALCVQVGRRRSRGGDIDQDSLALSTRRRGGALWCSQEVHQLLAEFDSSTDQGGAVGRIETRCDSLGVDRVQLTLATQDHATRESQPRGRQDRFVPRLSPGQALRAGAWCYAFKSRHDVAIHFPTSISTNVCRVNP